jgi:hypothetical protein
MASEKNKRNVTTITARSKAEGLNEILGEMSVSTSELDENKWVARDRKVGSELLLFDKLGRKLLKLNESVEHLIIRNAKKAAAQSQLALARRQ